MKRRVISMFVFLVLFFGTLTAVTGQQREPEMPKDTSQLVAVAHSAADMRQAAVSRHTARGYRSLSMAQSEQQDSPFSAGDIWLVRKGSDSLHLGQAYRSQLLVLEEIKGPVQVYFHIARWELIDEDEPMYDYHRVGRFNGLVHGQEIPIEYTVRDSDPIGFYQIIVSVFHEQSRLFYDIVSSFVVEYFDRIDDTGMLRVDSVSRMNLGDYEMLELIGNFYDYEGIESLYLVNWIDGPLSIESFYRSTVSVPELRTLRPGRYDLTVGQFQIEQDGDFYSQQTTLMGSFRKRVR